MVRIEKIRRPPDETIQVSDPGFRAMLSSQSVFRVLTSLRILISGPEHQTVAIFH
jgi:hypothetical protein